MLFFYIFSLFFLKHASSLAFRFDNIEHKRVIRQNGNVPGKRSSLVCCATNVDELPAMAKEPITQRQVPGTDFSQCGKSSYTIPKIVGGIANGNNANLGDWAWMAALYYSSDSGPDSKPRCSGSLISKNWVLTAAHCIDSKLTLTKVRLGDLNLNDSISDGATPIDVPVGEVIVHPEFMPKPLSNDIALIRLNYSVNFTVCVSNGQNEKLKGDDYYRMKVPHVTGYGKHGYLAELSTALQEAQVQTVDIVQCAKNYKGYNAVIDDRVLCAGGTGGRDSCQGSSGGPLVLPIGRIWYLIGIVSFGVGCGDPNYPGVYTKVAQYSDWISNVTGLQIAFLNF